MNLSKSEKALKYEILITREYSILDSIIGNSELILDIGSHLGFFTKYCLEQNQNLEIQLFEPVDEYLEKSKLYLHKYSDQLFFNNFGILGKTGKYKIYINEEKSMQSSLYNNTFLNKSKKFMNCSFMSFDDYFLENKINYIDLVKIDTEGSEFEILLNLSFQSFKKIGSIFFEYHLFNKDFENNFKQVLVLLTNYYNNIINLKSKYNHNIGYVLASKNTLIK